MLADAKLAKDKDDLGAVKSAFDKLTAASHKLAEVMYQEPGRAAPGGAVPRAPSPLRAARKTAT